MNARINHPGIVFPDENPTTAAKVEKPRKKLERTTVPLESLVGYISRKEAAKRCGVKLYLVEKAGEKAKVPHIFAKGSSKNQFARYYPEKEIIAAIEDLIKPIPEGWTSIPSMADKTNVSRATLWRMVRKYDFETRQWPRSKQCRPCTIYKIKDLLKVVRRVNNLTNQL